LIGRALAGVIALAFLCAAVTVAVIAAALALFWALVPTLGEAGAAAIVAGLFALIVAIVVVVVVLTTGRSHHHHHGGHHEEPHAEFDIIGKVFEMAREKPLWAAGAAVAAGLLAIRNPALVATIVAAFMDKPGSKSGR
jgi:hypothetical protein